MTMFFRTLMFFSFIGLPEGARSLDSRLIDLGGRFDPVWFVQSDSLGENYLRPIIFPTRTREKFEAPVTEERVQSNAKNLAIREAAKIRFRSLPVFGRLSKPRVEFSLEQVVIPNVLQEPTISFRKRVLPSETISRDGSY